MVNLFIDTSILIEELRCGSKFWGDLKLAAKEKKMVLLSSVIVLTELWKGQSMNRKENLEDFEEIIKIITFVNLNEKSAKLAGELARNYRVDGFDAVIAATAMECNAELATLNTKHFRGIKGLKLYDESL